MLPGLNHNVRYKECIFHVQTEDGGVDNPRLTTHVFLEGLVIADAGADYRDELRLPSSELREAVKQRMQAQHKQCMLALIRGAYDARIERALAKPDDTAREEVLTDANERPTLPASGPPPPRKSNPTFDLIDRIIENPSTVEDAELAHLLELLREPGGKDRPEASQLARDTIPDPGTKK